MEYTSDMNADFVSPVREVLRRAIVDYAFVRGAHLHPKVIRPRTGAVLTVRIAGSVAVGGHIVPAVTVGGVHENPYTLVPSEGGVDFVRVQFTTGGLRYFSRVAAITLRGRTVPAHTVFPGEMVAGLVADLRATGDVGMRVDALDRFFTSLYSPLCRRDAMVLDLSDRLLSSAEVESSGILSGAPVGRRQIERLFASLIGFSPRTFVRVARFERAQQEILSNPSSSLSDVALNAGYFDQSHFNRDFKQFTSTKPSSYSFCAAPEAIPGS